jgi:hypothetical protein
LAWMSSNSVSTAACTSPSPSAVPRISLPRAPSRVVVLPDPAGTRGRPQQQQQQLWAGVQQL